MPVLSRLRRLPRGRVVAALVLLGALGVLVQLARGARPELDVYAPVAVAQASVGQAYAVDGQVCVRSTGSGATLEEVRGTGTRAGLATELVLPPEGAPPVVGYPVAERAGRSPEGTDLSTEGTCLRLLLTAQRQGELRPPELELVVAYGPGRVLSRTLRVRPPTVLSVTRTGPDPRLAAS